MPPPSCCSKNSTRSTGDQEVDCSFHNAKSDSSKSGESSDEESKKQGGYHGVGIVKSLLGPSFEDAVLRTLEFGKSLIHKAEDNEPGCKEKKLRKQPKNSIKKKSENQVNIEMFLKEGREAQEVKMNCKNLSEGRATRKRIVFTAKLDKDVPMINKSIPVAKKLTNVSKIRSLDSDLKQVAPSPEIIKRQLEALIQINKDEPPEHAPHWSFVPKSPNFVEMTVMPSLCMYRNDIECNCSSSGEGQSKKDQAANDASSTSRIQFRTEERTPRRRLGAPSSICQAPEFLSNALGPTLDVSIIDNLKMMRDIFKCDSGRGEGEERQEITQVESMSHQSNAISNVDNDMQCRMEELMKKIRDLEQKEKNLIKQIEHEEMERDCRRKAFEEEERSNMKNCLENLLEEDRRRDECKDRFPTDCSDLDSKYENLKQRIECEEEKLLRLKDQYEYYKREITEAKNKKEAIKRNKSLLDAWDVIASRPCHTRLPSFSRACNLERKQFTSGDATGNIHCCFLPQEPEAAPESPKSSSCRKNRSRSRCRGECRSQSPHTPNSQICSSRSKDSHSGSKTKEAPFPLQRDITCGLHQSIKTCCCQSSRTKGAHASSEDEPSKKCEAINKEYKECQYPPAMAKPACRSRSETAMRREKSSKIVKVMWAVTRINIFQDNCRTYEVMDATSTPPACAPNKTEGIFVVKNPQRRLHMSKKRCTS